MAKKLTKKNADEVLARLAALVKTNEALRADLNEWLDEQRDNDAFGTEGQLDPRGDHRD